MLVPLASRHRGPLPCSSRAASRVKFRDRASLPLWSRAPAGTQCRTPSRGAACLPLFRLVPGRGMLGALVLLRTASTGEAHVMPLRHPRHHLLPARVIHGIICCQPGSKLQPQLIFSEHAAHLQQGRCSAVFRVCSVWIQFCLYLCNNQFEHSSLVCGTFILSVELALQVRITALHAGRTEQ